MSELKGCVGCGLQPTIQHWYRTGKKIATATYECVSMISYLCTNVDCPLHPHTTTFDTESEAAAAWNQRADGWISVKERLPECGELDDDLQQPYRWVVCDDGIVLAMRTLKYGWFNLINDEVTGVTFWMEKPCAPKEKEG